MRHQVNIQIFVLFIALALLAGCGGGGGGASTSAVTTPASTVSKGAIRGIILDPQTQNPVVGAIVTLNTSEDSSASASPSTVRRSINRLPLAMTQTDSTGTYLFQDVPVGSYNLSVSKDGKYGAQISAVVRQGEASVTIPPVVLTPVVKLVGSFRVEKDILGTDGLPQVLVWLLGTSLGSVPAVQDDTDPIYRVYRFQIDSVPVNGTAYQLQYFADGHISQTVNVSMPSPLPDSFVITLATVTLTHNPAGNDGNNPPTVSVAPFTSPVAPGATINMVAAGTDPDGDPLTYHWTQTGGNPVTLSTSGTTASFTAGPGGVYTFIVLARDDRGGTSLPASISVIVSSPVDNRPTGVALVRLNGGTGQPMITANVGDSVILSASASSDPEGSALTYQWGQMSGPTVTFVGGGVGTSALIEDTFSVILGGTYRFALVVADASGNRSDPTYVTVEVAVPAANQMPVASATVTPSGGVVPLTLALDGSGSSDPDVGDTISYAWTQLSGPAITLNNATTASADGIISQPGLYFFQLVVTDNSGLKSIPAIVTVGADSATNQSPVIVAEVREGGAAVTSVNPATAIELVATATDADSGPQPLTYQWVQLSGPAVIITNPTSATANTTLNQTADYTFRVTANDGDIVAESIVAISVNRAPAAVVAGQQSVTLLTAVSLDGSASWDPDGGTLTYSWVQVGSVPEPVTLTGATTATASFTPSEVGTYVFELVVNDGRASSIPATVRLHVAAPAFAGGGLLRTRENFPGTSDFVEGQAGVLPAGIAYAVKVFADPLLTTQLASGLANPADGSFMLSIGDNNPLIRDDKVYVAVAGTSTLGTPQVLVNDVTPPADPIINYGASDQVINGVNETGFMLTGLVEPNAEVAMRVNNLISGFSAADGAGSFTVSMDVTSETDGSALVALMVRDAKQNATAWTPVLNTSKDTTPPTLVLNYPVDGGWVRAIPKMSYDPSEELATLDFTFSDGGSNVSTLSVTNLTLLKPGLHEEPMTDLTPQLVDGITYSMDVTFMDLAGNSSSLATRTVNCDALPPALITVPAISSVPETNILVDYDLTNTETILLGWVKVTQDGGPVTDPHVPMTYNLQAADLSKANHTGVSLVLPFALRKDATYTFEFVFADSARNQTAISHSGISVVGLPEPGGFTLLKPAAGAVIAERPVLSYTLGEDVTSVMFEFQRTVDNSSTIPGFFTKTLSGALSLKGLHQNVFADAAPFLVDTDVYNLVVRVNRLDGSSAVVGGAEALIVDGQQPTLLDAIAVQSVIGEWFEGDQVIFTFDKPMDTTAFGGLADRTMLNNGIIDNPGGAARYTDWGPGTLAWSNNDTVLTLTLTGYPDLGTPFMAREPGSGVNGQVQTTTALRDRAGNQSLPVGPIELLSTGDTMAPGIAFELPLSDQYIPAQPVISYKVYENLGSLFLKIKKIDGASLTPVGAPIDVTTLSNGAANLLKGPAIPINFAAEGITALVMGRYTFILSGMDRAGNLTETAITNLTVDTTPPMPPNPAQLSYHNYSGGKVLVSGALPLGKSGEFLRVYLNGSPTPTQAVYSGPYSNGEVPIVGAGLAPGATVQYSLVDEAGNESARVDDGAIPGTSLTAQDSKYMQIVNMTGTLTLMGGQLSVVDGSVISLVLDQDPTQIRAKGFVTSGSIYAYMDDATVEAIISRSAANMPFVWYGITSPEGNVGALIDDGRLARLVSASASGNANNTLDSGDTIVLNFSSNVSAEVVLSGDDFGYGTGGQNNWTWDPGYAGLMPLNLAVYSVNVGSYTVSSLADGLTLLNVFNQPTHTVTVGPNLTASAGAEVLRLELNWPSSSAFRSDGDHEVLPSSHIFSNSSEGGQSATGY